MINLGILELLLVVIVMSEITILVYSPLSNNKKLKKRFDIFLFRRTLFGFYNRDIIAAFGIALLFFVAGFIPVNMYGVYLEFFLGFIGLIYMLSKIIASEKEIKRITGNYYFFPPEGIYR
ncbi:multipass membrane protein [Cuniculiplasma divulgatum]|uniref:Multipass membrane protein n=2 Tax=Cuniculiplasma divulgatum TaxID=1673428 RepID=A0A1N5SM49_9ARCH|nr:multipass membrane protein [Cuniculiplasma divulgatum]